MIITQILETPMRLADASVNQRLPASEVADNPGLELARLLLAVEATDQNAECLAPGSDSNHETLKTQAHLNRILKHVNLLAKFGAPHLAPLVQIFSTYVNRSMKRVRRQTNRRNSRTIGVRSLAP
jgi:hypothetical protein